MTKFRFAANLALFCAACFGLALAEAPRPVRAFEIVIEPEETNSTAEDVAQPEGEDVISLPESVARDEFSSLVLADLPRTIARDVDQIAANLTSATGISFEPVWFRVDMAKFVSPNPFKKSEVVAKLGMKIVADVASDLVLAHDLTPAAIQAEARLFMMHILVDRELGCFTGFRQNTTSGSNDMFGNQIVRIGGMVRVVGGSRPSNAQKEEANSNLFDATQVVRLAGSLADRRVLNALGVSVEDLKAYPLSARFPLESFQLNKYQANDEYGYRNYNYYDTSYESNSSAYVLSTQVGAAATTIPNGPNFSVNLKGLNLFMFMPWAMMSDSSYWYGSSNSSYGPPVIDAPTYTSLVMDKWEDHRSLSVEEVKAHAEAIRSAREAQDKEAYVAACSKALLEGMRSIAPSRLRWADKNAITTVSDNVDKGAPLRVAKRKLGDRAKSFISEQRAKNPDAPLPLGEVDWEFMRKYELEWSDFDIYPYDSSYFEFTKPVEPELAGQINFGTIENRVAADQVFLLRINPATGGLIWLKGEPESEETLLARKKEIRAAATRVVESVKSSAEGQVFDSAWIDEQLRNGDAFVAVTLADVEVDIVAPGFVRVSVLDPIGSFHQKCSLNRTTGSVFWETDYSEEKAVLPVNPYEYYEE